MCLRWRSLVIVLLQVCSVLLQDETGVSLCVQRQRELLELIRKAQTFVGLNPAVTAVVIDWMLWECAVTSKGIVQSWELGSVVHEGE